VLRALEEVEMRRVIVTLCSLALLVTAVAPAAAAAGPLHGRGGFSFDYSFAAGDLCPFPVRWVEDGSRMQALTFPVRPNGDQLVRYAGPQWSTVTNLATDATMVVGGGLRLDMLIHPDGTTDVRIAGTVVAGYLPTDAPGPSFWLLHGRVRDTLDASFVTTSHTFNGQAVDLCAALAG
jgi:hypothetical protein